MGNSVKMSFPVAGMSCASCAARVDKVLNRQKGVLQASVNYASAMARVEFDPEKCSEESLRKAVQDAGYDLLIPEHTVQEAEDSGESVFEEAERLYEKHYRTLRHKTAAAMALALPITVHGFYGCSVDEICSFRSVGSGRLLARRRFFLQCMETAETRNGQYGYLSGKQYRDCLAVQRIQYAVP